MITFYCITPCGSTSIFGFVCCCGALSFSTRKHLGGAVLRKNKPHFSADFAHKVLVEKLRFYARFEGLAGRGRTDLIRPARVLDWAALFIVIENYAQSLGKINLDTRLSRFTISDPTQDLD
jgi:hypothetical protein